MDAQLCNNLALWLLAIIMVAVLLTACTYNAPNRRL
jgi:hypothetical protein